MSNNNKTKNRFKDVTAISFTNGGTDLLINFHGFESESDLQEFTEYVFRKINMDYYGMEKPPTLH